MRIYYHPVLNRENVIFHNRYKRDNDVLLVIGCLIPICASAMNLIEIRIQVDIEQRAERN